jgi:hypothetical protein
MSNIKGPKAEIHLPLLQIDIGMPSDRWPIM